MAIRGRPVPDTSLTDPQLLKILREYVPETIRKMCDAMRVPRLRPWPRSGFRVEGGGRGNSGRSTIETYMTGDEFWPMMEWAGLQVARRISRRLREGETAIQIEHRFDLREGTIGDVELLARTEPSI